MSLKEKLKKLVEKTAKKEAVIKENYSEMSDDELAKCAEREGLEELIVKDGDGGLANREEIIQALDNLDNYEKDNEEMNEETDDDSLNESDTKLQKKIDIYIDGKYVASTNKSKTVKAAIEGYKEKYPEKTKDKKVTAEFVKESLNEDSENNYDDQFFVWDNGGEESEGGTKDRYTILLKQDMENPDRIGAIPILVSGNDPKGTSGHESAYLSDLELFINNGDEGLGKLINFSELPKEVQNFALSDYKDQLNNSQEEDENLDESLNEDDKDDEDLNDDSLDNLDSEDKDDLDDSDNTDKDDSEDEDDTEDKDKLEKVTVVVVSPELKKDDAEDDELSGSYELDDKFTKEHVEALHNGETLSEEFKEKSKTIFEAALNLHAKNITESLTKKFKAKELKLEKQFKKDLNEAKANLIEEQAKLIDGYLSEAIDTWINENKIALESNIRTELTEEFIDRLKGLFTESYIEIPENKFDLIKAQEEKIGQLEEALQQSQEKSLQYIKESKRLHCESVINKATADMTKLDKAKFIELLESVDFKTVDEFEKKVKTLKESYTKKSTITKKPLSEKKTTIQSDVRPIIKEEVLTPADIVADFLDKKSF